MSKLENSTRDIGGTTSPDVKDTRTTYIEERGLVPDYGDYSVSFHLLTFTLLY